MAGFHRPPQPTLDDFAVPEGSRPRSKHPSRARGARPRDRVISDARNEPQTGRALAMTIVGEVESLWRYPVKSMRGEELAEAFVGFAGVYGDRLFAFKSSARPAGFPYLTGREQEEMLLYRPRFRHPDKAARTAQSGRSRGHPAGLSPLFAASGGTGGGGRDADRRGAGRGGPRPAPHARRADAGRACADAVALGAGDDRLPSGLAVLAPDRAPARRRDRHRPRQAALPGERLPGSRLGGGLRRGSASSAAACGSARRRWSRSWSATGAAR